MTFIFFSTTLSYPGSYLVSIVKKFQTLYYLTLAKTYHAELSYKEIFIKYRQWIMQTKYY